MPTVYDYLNKKLIWTDAGMGRPVIETAELRGVWPCTRPAACFSSPTRTGDTWPCAAWSMRRAPSSRGVTSNHMDWLCTNATRPLALCHRVGQHTDVGADKPGRFDKWPNGIAVDESINRLYRADAECNSIELAIIDVANRGLIVEDVHHPFGVAVFEDRLYWSDWKEYATKSQVPKRIHFSRKKVDIF